MTQSAGDHGGGATDMLIEMIFDPVCPWCYIGKRQLERALSLRPALRPSLRWWPFVLNPEVPVQGVARTTFLLRKFGSDSRVSRLHSIIAELGRGVGIPFDFDRIQKTPNTLHAHRLIRFADRQQRAAEAVEAVFYTHFVRGRDIGDRRALIAIGRQLALDVNALADYLDGDDDLAQIQNDNLRAHRLGINGVPAFVFDHRFIICGAQEPPVLARMLDIAREAQLPRGSCQASPLDIYAAGVSAAGRCDG